MICDGDAPENVNDGERCINRSRCCFFVKKKIVEIVNFSRRMIVPTQPKVSNTMCWLGTVGLSQCRMCNYHALALARSEKSIFQNHAGVDVRGKNHCSFYKNHARALARAETMSDESPDVPSLALAQKQTPGACFCAHGMSQQIPPCEFRRVFITHNE